MASQRIGRFFNGFSIDPMSLVVVENMKVDDGAFERNSRGSLG
jgi:hypothetical protein